MNEQFLRRASLILSRPGTAVGPGTGGTELDLSEMHFTFKVNQSDFQTPNDAVIRVHNLKNETAQAVASREFSQVTLSAGYQGSPQYGVIFAGTIKQTRRGREMGHNNVNTYIDISAAEPDSALLSGFVSQTLQGNATDAIQQFDALRKAAGLQPGFVMDLPPNTLSRGKVLYGMARDHFRLLEQTHGGRVSMQNGRVQMVALDGYIPPTMPGAEAVVLNAATGLIGVPEVTQDGVKVRCLLNPNIVVSGIVQINNADVQDQLLTGALLRVPGRLEDLTLQKPSIPPGDGFYKVLVVEYCGDTRGRDWYSEITALGLTAAPELGGRVQPNAGR